MEGARAVAHERGRPSRKATMSDRDKMEDTTVGATCSNPSTNPAAADSAGAGISIVALPSTQKSTPMTITYRCH